ncbi:DUF4188 domain-containing protein [Tsukamurella pseudospumae]|uniref:DUF4188 domain-containing protein n=1 Tax=Tsukamurella pseudospumae TaxID=239498 RepID=UPI000AE93D4A|nr:DUF4188 domain-containing protein [Tsukamurella pseudospumae]
MKHDIKTDAHDGDVIVFLIGMQPRPTWNLGQAVFLTRSMFGMQRELKRDRRRGGAIGFLGGYNAFTTTGPMAVQYWRSFEDLERYARSTDFRHRPAWLKFYAMTHQDGRSRAGIWHETYRVPAGGHESIYGDLAKPVGLGAAVGVQPVGRRGTSARERIGA